MNKYKNKHVKNICEISIFNIIYEIFFYQYLYTLSFICYMLWLFSGESSIAAKSTQTRHLALSHWYKSSTSPSRTGWPLLNMVINILFYVDFFLSSISDKTFTILDYEQHGSRIRKSTWVHPGFCLTLFVVFCCFVCLCPVSCVDMFFHL
jgi:hypothetical protein